MNVSYDEPMVSESDRPIDQTTPKRKMPKTVSLKI